MRGLIKFWTRYLFNHSTAVQILHHDGSWNLFYDYPFYKESYSESRVGREIEILEIQLLETKK